MLVFSTKTQLYYLIYELHVSVTVGSDDQAIPKNIKRKNITAVILVRDLEPYRHVI
jgi:hypothetical protein